MPSYEDTGVYGGEGYDIIHPDGTPVRVTTHPLTHDPTYGGRLGGSLAHPYLPDYQAAGPPTEDGRTRGRGGGVGAATRDRNIWNDPSMRSKAAPAGTTELTTPWSEPYDSPDKDGGSGSRKKGAAPAGKKGKKGKKKKAKKELTIKEILQKSRDGNLKAINKTFKPLFKEMNRQLASGEREAIASGEGTRAGIAALAEDLRGQLDAIDEAVGKRRSRYDDEYGGDADGRTDIAALRELHDDRGSRTRSMAEENATGQSMLSQNIEQSSLSTLRNNDARLRAQLKSRRAAQRGAARQGYREQLLQAKLAERQAAAAAARGGGGGGGRRSSSSSDGPSKEELAAAAFMEKQLGLPPGTLVAADALGLSGTIAGHSLDQNRDDYRDRMAAEAAMGPLSRGEDLPFDLYPNQYAMAMDFLGQREDQARSVAPAVGRAANKVVDSVLGSGTASRTRARRTNGRR